jgi:hypothetical protein
MRNEYTNPCAPSRNPALKKYVYTNFPKGKRVNERIEAVLPLLYASDARIVLYLFM